MKKRPRNQFRGRLALDVVGYFAAVPVSVAGGVAAAGAS